MKESAWLLKVLVACDLSLERLRQRRNPLDTELEAEVASLRIEVHRRLRKLIDQPLAL